MGDMDTHGSFVPREYMHQMASGLLQQSAFFAELRVMNNTAQDKIYVKICAEIDCM